MNCFAEFDTSCLSHSVSLLTGDYGSVFSLVTNTELQPVKTLMSHALVCTVHEFASLHFKTVNVLLSFALYDVVFKCICLIRHYFYLCVVTLLLQEIMLTTKGFILTF